MTTIISKQEFCSSRKVNAKVVDFLALLIPLNFAKRNLQLFSHFFPIARLFKFEQIARLYTRKNNISITHSCLFSSHIHLLPFDFYSSYKVVTGQLKQSFIQVSFSQIGKEFKNKLFSVLLCLEQTVTWFTQNVPQTIYFT